MSGGVLAQPCSFRVGHVCPDILRLGTVYEVGLSYNATISTYFVLGLVCGSIPGVLRRFTYAWHGAAFVG